MPNASDHLPAGAMGASIHWMHTLDGAGQVYFVVRRAGAMELSH